jgi:hypothetical protein
MRTSAWLYRCLVLLVIFASATQAQSRVADSDGPPVATAIPILRVTMQNPSEINLGKPAAFVVAVTNQGQSPANDVIILTEIPEHVELMKTTPAPIEVDERAVEFRLGDLAPGATKRVTLVAIPRTAEPIKLNAAVNFATSSRTLLVRQPKLKLSAQVAPRVAIGTEVAWSVKVTNTGDGRAEKVLVTPSLNNGEVNGNPLAQPVQIGSLKPGETKEVQFTVVPTRRGEVSATFVCSNPDGLEVSEESTFRALQAELSVRAEGPKVQPLAREGNYQIVVTNPGDATTASTMVSVRVPEGLEITAAAENAYHARTRTLRWRLTKVRPSDVVRLPFRAETVTEGDQTLRIVAQSAQIPEATTTHTTTVISRPNLSVTVLNEEELSAIGDRISFKVTMVNAGSKPAEDLKIRVPMPAGLEAVDSENYQVTDGVITFPTQKLDSGEKVTLVFQVIGQQAGESRVRVLIDGPSLTRELSFEGSTFCYSRQEVSVRRSAEGDSPNDA